MHRMWRGSLFKMCEETRRVCISSIVFNNRLKSNYHWEIYCSYNFCGVCLILIKRPPNREQLMELKSKDLQQYLNKNSISTHGLVGN